MTLRHCVLGIAALVSADCGSATDPSGSQLVPIRPTYVDSVIQANCHSGGGDGACHLATAAMVGIAAGAVPSRLSVQPADASTWSAIVVTTYKPSAARPGMADTTEYIVFYRDTTFTYGAIINVYADSGIGFGGGNVYANNVEQGGADVVGSTAIRSVGGPCAAVPGLTATLPFPLDKCRLASFEISAALGLGAFKFITIGRRPINGVITGPL